MVKIIIAGPKNSGKTSIANFLCGGHTEIGTKTKTYDPTVGCRVLEAECSGFQVELWDVSGDQSYEKCWPAIMLGVDKKDEGEGADGVILVYNPEQPTHDQEVGLWYDQYVKNAGISDKKCLVLVHRSKPDAAYRSRAPPKLENCKLLNSTFSSTSEIREHFEDFLRAVGDKGGFGTGAAGRGIGDRK